MISRLGNMHISRLGLRSTPLDPLDAFGTPGGHDATLVPIYCGDDVIDPDAPGFVDRLDAFGDLTGCDAYTWKGYIDAHGIRRETFKVLGCRQTEHRHPTARAIDLDQGERVALFRKVCIGKATALEAEQFRAVMLVEMARLSAEDGLAMHIHAGRGRASIVRSSDGRDVCVAAAVDYVGQARPLLDLHGADTRFEIVFATGRMDAIDTELGPLSQAYPAVRIALADAAANPPGRIRQFRECLLACGADAASASMPAMSADLAAMSRQVDHARRVDCAVLAERVAMHEFDMAEAIGLLARWAALD